jgi:hypothetical protein
MESDYQVRSSQYPTQTLLNMRTTTGQLKLLKAAVVVVGAGGLGCSALQYLVAAGVGESCFSLLNKLRKTNSSTVARCIQPALGSSTTTSSKYQTSRARRFTRNLWWEDPRQSALPLRSKSSVVTPSPPRLTLRPCLTSLHLQYQRARALGRDDGGPHSYERARSPNPV